MWAANLIFDFDATARTSPAGKAKAFHIFRVAHAVSAAVIGTSRSSTLDTIVGRNALANSSLGVTGTVLATSTHFSLIERTGRL